MYSQQSAIDLTTVAQVKAWRSSDGAVPAANADDANVQLIITAISQEWLRLTSRGSKNWSAAQSSPFNQAVSYSETYDGNGSQRLHLRNTPITAVASLVINGAAISASAGYGSAGYAISDDGKSIILRGGGGTSFQSLQSFYPSGTGQYFAKGLQNISITYSAGFAASTVTDKLTIPATPPYTLQTLQAPVLADSGVKYFSNGVSFAAVQIAPTAGQYFLQSLGSYLFAAADAGQVVLISYQLAGTPADIVKAATQMAAENVVRRRTIDRKSDSMAGGAGTTTYRDWWVSPEVERVIVSYTRTAVV